nr:MAG: hypothetical protein [Bacteriophage sp.]
MVLLRPAFSPSFLPIENAVDSGEFLEYGSADVRAPTALPARAPIDPVAPKADSVIPELAALSKPRAAASLMRRPAVAASGAALSEDLNAPCTAFCTLDDDVDARDARASLTAPMSPPMMLPSFFPVSPIPAGAALAAAAVVDADVVPVRLDTPPPFPP